MEVINTFGTKLLSHGNRKGTRSGWQFLITVLTEEKQIESPGCAQLSRGQGWRLSPQDHWIRERCVIQCHCCCFVTQSCPTLCNPTDCGPPGSPVHGILRARILEPFPSPGDLPDPGIEPKSPVLAGRFFTAEPSGKPSPW